jgi:type IV pilus assembly protein PilY1
MNNVTRIIIATIFGLLVTMVAQADDVDIYFKNNVQRASPPYLMFVVDYHPGMFIEGCGTLASCYQKLSAKVLIQLCIGRVASNTLTSSQKSVLCRRYVNDLADDGHADDTTAYGKLNLGYATTLYDVYASIVSAVVFDYSGINIGLMASNKGGGGTILQGYGLLKPNDDTHRDLFIRKLWGIRASASIADAHTLELKDVFSEHYRYLNGLAYINQKNTYGNFSALAAPRVQGMTDYDSCIIKGARCDPRTGYPLDASGEVISGPTPDDGVFLSPFKGTEECVKLFGFVMAMNAADQSASLDSSSDAFLAWMADEHNDLLLDTLLPGKQNMLNWMASDKNRIHISQWAESGGTGDGPLLLGSGAQQFEQNLRDIFAEILSTSSSFVAASVPVNVFYQTKSLDDFYLAFFEAKVTEVWPGNVKKLALLDANNDGQHEIVDVETYLSGGDEQAISTVDGHIAHDALTFWTDATALSAPSFQQLADMVVNGKDGREVSRGGAGQKIPGFITGSIAHLNGSGTRQLFTTNADNDGLMPLNADDNSALELFDSFSLSTAEKSWLRRKYNLAVTDSDTTDEAKIAFGKLLLRYLRGVDIDRPGYDLYRNSSSGPARKWLMGDVIHSRPVTFNYGYVQNPDTGDEWKKTGNSGSTKNEFDNPYVSIVFGSNDGFLRFIRNTDGNDGNDTKGNRADMVARQSGVEQFAFIPRELMSNTIAHVKNDGSYDNPYSTNNHPYGMDGAPSAIYYYAATNTDSNIRFGLDGDSNPYGDYMWVYAGMRRGGKSYYAFDISNPFDVPLYKGSISHTAGGDFDELGLTFSKITAAAMQIVDASTNVSKIIPVLVFGGGYDIDKDSIASDYRDTHGANPDDEGNAIYIVNADTLELIWKATYTGVNSNEVHVKSGMRYAVPSQIRVIDTDQDGLMDRLYVGDVAGNIWRGDFPRCVVSGDSCDNHRRDTWKITKLASLGEAESTSRTHAGDVRFFHAPSIAFVKQNGVLYDAVMIGSGDRPSPLEHNDRNYFFLIKDTNIVSGAPSTSVIHASDLADFSKDGCTADIHGLDCTGWTSSQFATGYKIAMKTGEKILSTPLVANGEIFFTTYDPSGGISDSCAPAEGVSNLFLIDLVDGTAANDNSQRYQNISTGMAGDVVAAGDNIILPGSATRNFLTGDDSSEIMTVKDSGANGFRMIYWNEPGRDSLQ